MKHIFYIVWGILFFFSGTSPGLERIEYGVKKGCSQEVASFYNNIYLKFILFRLLLASSQWFSCSPDSSGLRQNF